MLLYLRAPYVCAMASAVALVAVGCTSLHNSPDQGGRQFVSADPAEDAVKGDRPVVMANNDLKFLVANSPLVFRGEVVEQEPFLDETRDVVVTRNVFAIREVIVGDYTEDTITLNILGGTIGDRVMRVSHLPQFEVGGLYVVFTDAARTTYNPVTANEHGVFRVDPSTETMYSASDFQVTGIEDTRLVFGAERLDAAKPDEHSLSSDTMADEPEISGDIVRLQPAPTETREAITYDRFAEAVRRIADTL